VGVYCLYSVVRPESNWVYALSAFVAAQCVWHGIVTGGRRYGLMLFPVVWLAVLRFTMPEPRYETGTEAYHHLVRVTGSLVLGLQVLFAVADRRDAWHRVVRPLARPLQGWAALVMAGLSASLLAWAVHEESSGVFSLVLVIVAVFATARANHSGMLALVGSLLVYVLACTPVLDELVYFHERVRVLETPWRVGLFALALASAVAGGTRLYRRAPTLLAAPDPLRFDRVAVHIWLNGAAGLFALGATFLHSFTPMWQAEKIQLFGRRRSPSWRRPSGALGWASARRRWRRSATSTSSRCWRGRGCATTAYRRSRSSAWGSPLRSWPDFSCTGSRAAPSWCAPPTAPPRWARGWCCCSSRRSTSRSPTSPP
jgi:hypothetical protein